MKRRTHFFYVCAVGANGFMQLVACDAKLFRPVRNIRRDLWIDLFRIVRALGVLLVNRMRLVNFCRMMVLGQT